MPVEVRSSEGLGRTLAAVCASVDDGGNALPDTQEYGAGVQGAREADAAKWNAEPVPVREDSHGQEVGEAKPEQEDRAEQEVGWLEREVEIREPEGMVPKLWLAWSPCLRAR